MGEMETKAQADLLALINNPKIGGDIGRIMAEIAIELADAKLEAKHWKAAFETVRNEVKVMAATLMHEKGERRLVVTLEALRNLPGNMELYVGQPEPGVRIYEMRERDPVAHTGVPSGLLLPPGNA